MAFHAAFVFSLVEVKVFDVLVDDYWHFPFRCRLMCDVDGLYLLYSIGYAGLHVDVEEVFVLVRVLIRFRMVIV